MSTCTQISTRPHFFLNKYYYCYVFSGRVHSVTRRRASSSAAGEGGTEVCEEEARKARFSLSFVLLLFLLFRRGKKRRGKKRKGREEALVSVSALLFGDWPRDCVAKNAAAGKKKKRKQTYRRVLLYLLHGMICFRVVRE